MGGKRDVTLPDGELKRLMAYDWPGNVRELKNVLERALIIQRGLEFRPSELLTKMKEPEAGAQDAVINSSSDDNNFATLEEVENKYIKLVLGKLSGNRLKTAETLGISLATLKRRIRDIRSK
jgi:DNA-binding NtrC family response regulator